MSLCTLDLLSEWGLKDIKLRTYQIEGVNWFSNCVKNNHGGILADEMGLGKTIQSISAILSFREIYKFKKFIIISPLSVINNWKTEMEKFAPCLKFVVYMGGQNVRQNLRQSAEWSAEQLVIVTTYEYLIQDAAHITSQNLDALFMDEGHRIKNHEAVLYKIVDGMPVKFKFLLTGTPIQNNLDEFFNLLLIVVRTGDKSLHTQLGLTSRTGFKRLMESLLARYVGGDGDDKPSDQFDCIVANCPAMQRIMLRRTKAVVLRGLLPQKREVVLFHGLTDTQKQLYKSFLTKDNKILQLVLLKKSGGTEVKRLLNVLMQVRKCVLHPYLFPGVEPEPFQLGEHLVQSSQKMEVLDKLLRFLLTRKHKVLIFSQMTRMLDIIQDFCTLRGYEYERLDGSVRSEERFAAIEKFSARVTTRLFLLSTRAGGQGLNLTAADTVVFVDSDFNPQVDLQAMARVHRPGQTRACRTVRLVARHSVEEMMVSRAQHKLRLTRGILGHEDRADESGSDKQLANVADILCYGLDELFGDSSSDGDNPVVTDELLTSILGDTDETGCWLEPAQPHVSGDQEPTTSDQVQPAPTKVTDVDDLYLFDGHDFSALRRKPDHKKVLKILNVEDVTQTAPSPKINTAAQQPLLNMGRQLKGDKSSNVPPRKQKLWQDNGYKSANVARQPRSPEESNEDETAASDSGGSASDMSGSIHYVLGDVTRPVAPHGAGSGLRVVCHLVDNSGSWGSGGVFSAIDRINKNVSVRYMTAFEMEDLQLGDCHTFSLCDGVELALLVGQGRDKNDRLQPIQMNHVQQCLESLARYAIKHNASVHLPRIGYRTPQFNWYGAERLIIKELVEKGIETFVYYYRRGSNTAPTSSPASFTNIPGNSPGVSSSASSPIPAQSISTHTAKHSNPLAPVASSAIPATNIHSSSHDRETTPPSSSYSAGHKRANHNPASTVASKRAKSQYQSNCNKKSLSERFFSSAMSGIVVFFDDSISQYEQETMSRHILALDGDVSPYLVMGTETTHLVHEPLDPNAAEDVLCKHNSMPGSGHRPGVVPLQRLRQYLANQRRLRPGSATRLSLDRFLQL